MTLHCRMTFIPGDTVKTYRAGAGDTYERALLSFGINPDTVLIMANGESIPQDSVIEEEVVVIVLTGLPGLTCQPGFPSPG